MTEGGGARERWRFGMFRGISIRIMVIPPGKMEYSATVRISTSTTVAQPWINETHGAMS